MSEPEEAEHFRKKMNSPQLYICDPKAKLYHEMRLEEGGVGQFLGPNVVRAGAAAFLKGNRLGRPVGNPKILGGTFILGANGRVVWEHRDKDASDFARVEAIERGLESI